MEAIFAPISTFAARAASPASLTASSAARTASPAICTTSSTICTAFPAICAAMAEKFIRRRDIVISGFAVIVSRREIVVSHHEMTLDVISAMIGALGGVAPEPSALTGTVGRAAEAATHGVTVPTDIASMVAYGKM